MQSNVYLETYMFETNHSNLGIQNEYFSLSHI